MAASQVGYAFFAPFGETGIKVEPGFHLPVHVARTAALLGPRFPWKEDTGRTVYLFPNIILRDRALDLLTVSYLLPVLS
jgi:hypothetical protein